MLVGYNRLFVRLVEIIKDSDARLTILLCRLDSLSNDFVDFVLLLVNNLPFTFDKRELEDIVYKSSEGRRV